MGMLDTSPTYLSFLIFHAHIISFVTCFICILLHLFTFSWTNLLTRCPVPVSYFLQFFISEKLHRKYSQNCTGRKSPSIFSELHGTKIFVHRDRRRDGGGLWSPHTTWRRGSPPPGALGGGVGPIGLPRGQASAHI